MNNSLTKEQLIKDLSALGTWLKQDNGIHDEVIRRAGAKNAWFTESNIRQAISAYANALDPVAIDQWLSKYTVNKEAKVIGLILAGNIPLVGFHDVIAVLASGNYALIKLSSQDDVLVPHILNRLTEINPVFSERIRYADRLENFDAVIATGSNNTSRYFEYYFGKYPHIIRRNRNSVAVLTGMEKPEELKALGKDIFDYFGLGCRNVSKLYIPEGYDIARFFEAVQSYEHVAQHYKYNNNYDYNKSIYLVNSQEHYDNGFLLLTRDERMASPLAVLYYEQYTDLDSLRAKLDGLESEIQCIVSPESANIHGSVRFGQTQCPGLDDYADRVDTMQFLNSL